ncbi:SDR family NAD(P)-dependent oxidoreductase [Primorskyibacter sp. 2E107]|uniref:SDR family NAD(P)-dependent oxidoreductase n=1 Tax=Primorskyibacter sp. 2E107 TaxID=3403458 RepID=UPI003AF4185F
MNAAVLITGGASGIGRAVAERVVARGARAILWDVSGAALEATCADLGPLADGRVVDVGDATAVAEAGKALNAPTHLVNNAGILGGRMDWQAIDPVEVSRILAINVTGMMQVTSAFLNARVAHPQASIVNIASIAGENGGAPGFASYGASKGAILALTRALARDLAPEVRVNALAPGIIDTPIQSAVLGSAEARTQAEAGIPMGRMGTPEEVAEAADWLLFKASYATGESLRIAGGRR